MIAVASGASREFAPLMALTSPGKREYCQNWNLEYIELEFPNNEHLEQEEYVRGILARADIEWLWWTDADLLITNHQINIASLCDPNADIILTVDWYGTNNGSVLYHNTAATRALVDTCIAERRLLHPGELKLAQELWPRCYQGYEHEKTNQGVITAVMAVMAKSGSLRVKWLPQRALNSYKLDEHNLSIDFETRRHFWDTGGWRPGDLALHLAAQTMETRLRVFTEFQSKVIRIGDIATPNTLLHPEPAPREPGTRRLIAVTATGDRPECFSLAQRYMARQTLQPYLWLVVDDGKIPLTFNPDLKLPPLCYLRREPRPDDPWHTLVPNLRRALSMILPDDVVVCMEDDDWVSRDYLERMNQEINGFDIAGMGHSLYLDVRTRRYFRHRNLHHCSLGCTAFTGKAIEVLRDECASNDPMIDIRLWAHGELRQNIFFADQRPLIIGMKGMPGRTGADGHDPAKQKNWPSDNDFSMLRSFIGNDIEDMGYGNRYVGSKAATMMIFGPPKNVVVGQRR